MYINSIKRFSSMVRMGAFVSVLAFCTHGALALTVQVDPKLVPGDTEGENVHITFRLCGPNNEDGWHLPLKHRFTPEHTKHTFTAYLQTDDWPKYTSNRNCKEDDERVVIYPYIPNHDEVDHKSAEACAKLLSMELEYKYDMDAYKKALSDFEIDFKRVSDGEYELKCN